MALLEQIRTLKEQMTKLEAWETEKQRYLLTDFGGGTFAYVLKKEAAQGEPIHKLCATCLNKGHKTILQHSHDNWYDCPTCGTNQRLGPTRNINYDPPPAEYY
jgi:hypothetical protein